MRALGSDRTRGALTWTLVVAGYAALLSCLFWRVLFRRQVCGWDCLDEYWPDLIFESRALASGQLPLWNPYTLGGYAFHADPQAGILFPINWICALLSYVFGVGAWMIELKVLLLFMSGLLGMHVVVWRWTKNHLAAVAAAVTFVVGSPTLVHKNSALLWPLLVMPWAFAAWDAFRDRPTPRRGLLLGVAVACVAVSHPQGALYAALALAFYISYELAVALRKALRDRRLRSDVMAAIRRFGPGLACALLVAGTWSAIVYIPTWITVDSSARAGRSVAWALSDPLRPRSLEEFLVPGLDTNWMQDIYLGSLAIVIPLWAARRDRLTAFWLVLGTFSVLLALGTHGHVLPFLASHVPGFRLFRIAYRYKLLTGFACAAALGRGIGVLATTRPSRADAWLLISLAVGWLGAAVLVAGRLPPWAAVLALAAVGAAAFDGNRRRRSAWVLAAVALLTVDLWRAGETKLAILQPRPTVERGIDLLERMPGIDHTWRYFAARYSGSGGNLPVPYQASAVHEVREISGFEQPLVPQRTLDVLAMAKREPAVLAHFNTKYFIGASPRGARRVEGTPIAMLDDVAPIARLYPAADLVPSAEGLAKLTRLQPTEVTKAMVDPLDGPPELPNSTFAPVDGRLVTYERSRLVIDIDAPAAGILVVNEALSPAWRVSIDGSAAPLFRANYMLRSVVVPPGHHRIVLTYSRGYGVSIVLGVIEILVVIVLLCVRWSVLDRSFGASA